MLVTSFPCSFDDRQAHRLFIRMGRGSDMINGRDALHGLCDIIRIAGVADYNLRCADRQQFVRIARTVNPAFAAFGIRILP
jgi:hypothetical protein